MTAPVDARAAAYISGFQPVVLIVHSRRVHRDTLRLVHAFDDLALGCSHAVDSLDPRPSFVLDLPALLVFRTRDHARVRKRCTAHMRAWAGDGERGVRLCGRDVV